MGGSWPSYWLGGRLPRGLFFLPPFHCFRLRSFSTGFLASLRGRRRALGFLPLPRLRIRLAKSNAKDGFRVLGSRDGFRLARVGDNGIRMSQANLLRFLFGAVIQKFRYTNIFCIKKSVIQEFSYPQNRPALKGRSTGGPEAGYTKF